MWVSISTTEASNRQREVMKQQLNNPLVTQFANAPMVPTQTARPAATALPAAVRLQVVRATSSRGDELIVRLQHRYAAGEDSEFSAPADVDISAFVLDTVLARPKGVTVASVTETTL